MCGGMVTRQQTNVNSIQGRGVGKAGIVLFKILGVNCQHAKKNMRVKKARKDMIPSLCNTLIVLDLAGALAWCPGSIGNHQLLRPLDFLSLGSDLHLLLLGQVSSVLQDL
jgi:hypothetical protein